MELSKEVIELIEKEAEDMSLHESVSPSDWEYITKYYRVGMKEALNNHAILKAAKLYTQEEVDKMVKESYLRGIKAIGREI